jgi:hypothetical protein
MSEKFLQPRIPPEKHFSMSLRFGAVIKILAKESSLEHHLASFPMKHISVSRYESSNFLLEFYTDVGYGTPELGIIKNQEDIDKATAEIIHNPYPSYERLKALFPEHISQSKFLYLGMLVEGEVSINHFMDIIPDWLNEMVLPIVLDQNKRRVLDAIPTPPEFNVQPILKSIYVLEDTIQCSQGTAFHLKGIGLITNQHCLSDSLEIFSPAAPAKRFKVSVVASNPDIDLAVIQAEGLDLGGGLEAGSSDDISLMDHVALSGFPNYRIGDSGILSPGLVIAFRPVSGIQRILINAPIVQGNSGGPVINAKNEVIGVAVTGAKSFGESSLTEDHGVIPISAIKYLPLKLQN